MVMTETRSSALFFVISASVLIFSFKVSKGVVFTTSLLVAGVIFFFYVHSDFGISLNLGLADIVSGKADSDLYRTGETSSVITRLFTWHKSYDMYLDYYLFGAGPGMWSYLKLDYGIPYVGLLDPHNDIIHYAVSYGIFGLIFYFLVYLRPIYIYALTSKVKKRSDLLYFSILLLFFLASLANSLTWKHQFAVLVFWFSLTLTFSIKKSENTNV